jgi:hypothetical protein
MLRNALSFEESSGVPLLVVAVGREVVVSADFVESMLPRTALGPEDEEAIVLLYQ